MKRVVHTGLPAFGRPTEHAVMADGHLRTTAVPLKMDGTFEVGDAGARSRWRSRISRGQSKRRGVRSRT
jgi:hypothetical protein